MFCENIPRIRLENFPTPLERLERLEKHLSSENRIFMKRDDLMSIGTGGNKIRSLEFWLADGMAKKADVFIAAGLPQSNLCRLTAAACCKLGLECHIIHNASKSSDMTGNQLLNNIMGVKRIFCGDVDEYGRNDFVRLYADKLRHEGRNPYIVGDMTLGALGYVNAAFELVQQLDTVKHVFISASAGPTETGVLFGLCLMNKDVKLHLVSVEYEKDKFCSIAEGIFEDLKKKTGLKPEKKPWDVGVFHGEYLGEGYAVPTASSIEAVRTLAENEGIFMETTYNAKVLDCMTDMVRKGSLPEGEDICIFNTGGTAALLGQGHYFIKHT